jgi:signal transduction histidine kinase
MGTPAPWYNRTSLILATALTSAFLAWVLYTALEALFFPTTPFPQLLITAVPLPDILLRVFVSACFFYVGILLIQAIARQKKHEQTLQDLNETLRLINTTLEQKIQEKTKEVNLLLRQKNDLIIGLSHDLKTPLTPLMGLLPTIIKNEQDPKLKDLLIISLRNVHYLRDLVSRAIDLALLDSTILGFSVEKTHLFTEVDTVLENRASLLQHHHLIVDNTIDESLFVHVDKLKLREVLNNLVMNAVTYSLAEGGTLTLEAKRQQNDVVISVTDTGIGLTPEQLDTLFDEFYKADDARHDHKKTGLSLSICKRIVEKHGGKIWVTSPGPGKGTTVCFTLPAARENEPAHPKRS